MYEFTPVGWLKHCVFHPVEGFEDLRWKKQGSMKISMLIVLFLFIAMVVDRQLTGFQFNDSYVKVFNVVPLIVQSVVYFFTWVLGNWAICTLLDGEGTLKKDLHLFCIFSCSLHRLHIYRSDLLKRSGTGRVDLDHSYPVSWHRLVCYPYGAGNESRSPVFIRKNTCFNYWYDHRNASYIVPCDTSPFIVPAGICIRLLSLY